MDLFRSFFETNCRVERYVGDHDATLISHGLNWITAESMLIGFFTWKNRDKRLAELRLLLSEQGLLMVMPRNSRRTPIWYRCEAATDGTIGWHWTPHDPTSPDSLHGREWPASLWYPVSQPKTGPQDPRWKSEAPVIENSQVIQLLNKLPWYVVAFNLVARNIGNSETNATVFWFLDHLHREGQKDVKEYLFLTYYLLALFLGTRHEFDNVSFYNDSIRHGNHEISALWCAKKFQQLDLHKDPSVKELFLHLADNIIIAAENPAVDDIGAYAKRAKEVLKLLTPSSTSLVTSNGWNEQRLFAMWLLDSLCLPLEQVDVSPLHCVPYRACMGFSPVLATILIPRYRQLCLHILEREVSSAQKVVLWLHLAATFTSEEETIQVSGKSMNQNLCLLEADIIRLKPKQTATLDIILASANGASRLVPTSCSRALDWWSEKIRSKQWRPNRPCVIGLFGPPGTGKNEMVRRFAKQLWLNERERYSFDRFYKEYNMSTFTTEHSISILMGTVPGVQGGSGALSRAIAPSVDPMYRGEPHHVLRVLYLDEFMLAHGKIKQTLGGFFEDGKFEDQSGAVVHCKLPFFVFLSSNPKDPPEEMQRNPDSINLPNTLCRKVLEDEDFKSCENQEALLKDPRCQETQKKLEAFQRAMFSNGLEFIGDRCLRVYVAAQQNSKEFFCAMFTKFMHEAGRQVTPGIRIGWTKNVIDHFYNRWKKGDWQGWSGRKLRNVVQVIVLDLLPYDLNQNQVYYFDIKEEQLCLHSSPLPPELIGRLTKLDQDDYNPLSDSSSPNLVSDGRTSTSPTQPRVEVEAVCNERQGGAAMELKRDVAEQRDKAQQSQRPHEELASLRDYLLLALLVTVIVLLIRVITKL